MQQEIVQGAGTVERRTSDRLFHRDLPGGGYVAIDVIGPAASERRVRIVVERRGELHRRTGHRPPVIHDEPWLPERGIGELYRVACDNVAIARALLIRRRVD